MTLLLGEIVESGGHGRRMDREANRLKGIICNDFVPQETAVSLCRAPHPAAAKKTG